MQKSKLIELIKTLSNKELRHFDDYVQSPFFNKNDHVTALFQYLKKFHPDYEDKKLDKEYVFKKLFPKAKFYSQKLRNLMSELAKLLEGFLVLGELEKNSSQKDIWLLDVFTQRYLDKHFQHKLNEANKNQKRVPHHDSDYYHAQYSIENAAYSFSVVNSNRPVETNLQQVINNLDHYYLALKLRYSCAIFNRQSLLAVSYDVPMLDEILHFLENNKHDDIAAIALYHHLLLLLKNETQTHYEKLIALLDIHKNGLPTSELRQIYTALFNYFNKKLKSGNPEYLSKIFDLYKIMLEREIIFVEGYISPYQHFRNIVIAALRLGELPWAEQFIQDYSIRVVPERRENMVNYCMAELNFFKKDYQQTLNFLLSFEFQDAYNYVEHKRLLLKSYYELDEMEPFEALAHAFRNYLRRNKTISEYNKKSFHNFIRLLNKLYKARLDKSHVRQDLAHEITATDFVADSEWLLEKVKELK